MSSQPPPNPFPLNPVFNPLDWGYADNTYLTIAIANTLYLQKDGDTATGLINFSEGLISTSGAFSGLLTSSAVVLQSSNDTTVPTTAWVKSLANGLFLLKAGDTATGLINFNAGLTTSTAVVTDTLTFKEGATTIGTIATTASDLSIVAVGSMSLQATNATNNAYIELNTDLVRTLNNKEIDFTSTGVINLGTPSNMTLSGATITLTTPFVSAVAPSSNQTYLQMATNFVSGISDNATLLFHSTNQAAQYASIQLNSLSSMAMTIASAGSISLNSAIDGVRLSSAPSGTVNSAVATVGYVNAGYIPITGGLPVGTIIMWGGNYTNPPANYLMCSGFPVPVANNPYPLLFSVIGFNYNLAPSTTFWALPLFNQNRMPISADSNLGGNPLSTVVNSAGEVYGGSSTISIDQMPSHNHVIECRMAGSGGGSSNVVDTGNPNNTQDSNVTGGGAPYAPQFTAVWFLIKYQ